MPTLFQRCATAEGMLMGKTVQSLPSWRSWILIFKMGVMRCHDRVVMKLNKMAYMNCLA